MIIVTLNRLLRYKMLTDFTDKMEKDNYKYVEKYISQQLKLKNTEIALNFVDDAIDLLEKRIQYKKEHKIKFEY